MLGLLMMLTSSWVQIACCLVVISNRPVPPRYLGLDIFCWEIVCVFSFHRNLKISDCIFFLGFFGYFYMSHFIKYFGHCIYVYQE